MVDRVCVSFSNLYKKNPVPAPVLNPAVQIKLGGFWSGGSWAFADSTDDFCTFAQLIFSVSCPYF